MANISRRRAAQSVILGAVAVAALRPASSIAAGSGKDALTMMIAEPRFSDWVQILQFSGLQQYAASTPGFTAFVPTNAAFAKYPDILNELLAGKSRAFPETTVAVDFVRSHVLLDLHPLSEFSGKTTQVTSMSGTPIEIDGTQSGDYLVKWTSVKDRYAWTHISGPPVIASNAIIYPFDDVVLS